jgi:hypothetical protein
MIIKLIITFINLLYVFCLNSNQRHHIKTPSICDPSVNQVS